MDAHLHIRIKVDQEQIYKWQSNNLNVYVNAHIYLHFFRQRIIHSALRHSMRATLLCCCVNVQRYTWGMNCQHKSTTKHESSANECAQTHMCIHICRCAVTLYARSLSFTHNRAYLYSYIQFACRQTCSKTTNMQKCTDIYTYIARRVNTPAPPNICIVARIDETWRSWSMGVWVTGCCKQCVRQRR